MSQGTHYTHCRPAIADLLDCNQVERGLCHQNTRPVQDLGPAGPCLKRKIHLVIFKVDFQHKRWYPIVLYLQALKSRPLKAFQVPAFAGSRDSFGSQLLRCQPRSTPPPGPLSPAGDHTSASLRFCRGATAGFVVHFTDSGREGESHETTAVLEASSDRLASCWRRSQVGVLH